MLNWTNPGSRGGAEYQIGLETSTLLGQEMVEAAKI